MLLVRNDDNFDYSTCDEETNTPFALCDKRSQICSQENLSASNRLLKMKGELKMMSITRNCKIKLSNADFQRMKQFLDYKFELRKKGSKYEHKSHV